MAQPQIPFISAPFKRTTDVDWIYPLKHYIAHVYQEDPEKYNEETFTLNRLRQDMRGAGSDTTGRDLLYRYFGQLELLDLRFLVDEKHVKILFNWYDAFNGRATAQYSLAYEKASVIFNIAATLSAIAASQNRAEAEGRKKTFNFFQAAAGMFQYINDNFLHAPSQDLSRETVKMLSELMLAQAHECFLESSLREKKKDGLIAKLASHAVWVYGNLVDEMQDAVARGVGLDKSWITICQVKQKYYQALAQQHKAAACGADSQYGEQIARLKVAETSAKDANKLCSSLISQLQSSNHANGTLPADAGSVLQELTKSIAATCGEKCAAATRDNDMIYHDHVPQESILMPIDRLKAVKPIAIAELYGQNDIAKVIGPDIFARLVPLRVHESSSMYSEEKAKLLRGESERCDLAKAEVNTALEYMKLPGSLDKFKKQADLSIDELLTPTKEAREWADEIALEESPSRTSVRELIETLNGSKQHAKQQLDEASLALDQEMSECEKMRVKFGELWTQAPSAQVASDFRQDIRNHRDTLERAAQSDRELMHRLDDIMSDINILKQGGKSSALDKAFAESASAISSQKLGENGVGTTESLLDLDFAASAESKSSMEAKVKRVEAALEKLRKIENERKETLNDLREKTMQDDISNVLILNKKAANIEQQIFATELEKYRPHQQRISASIQQQQQVIQELGNAFKALMEDKQAEKLQARYDNVEKQRRKIASRLEFARKEYMNIKDGLSKGIQFYSNISDVAESLLRNVQKFTHERGQERQRLAEELESSQSMREQELLREKINNYTTTTPSAPTLPEYNPQDLDQLARLTEQTRGMSLNDSNRPVSSNYSYAAFPTTTTAFENNRPVPTQVIPPSQTPHSYSAPTPSTSSYQPPPTQYPNYSGVAPPPPLPLPTQPSYNPNYTSSYARPPMSNPLAGYPTTPQQQQQQPPPPPPPKPMTHSSQRTGSYQSSSMPYPQTPVSNYNATPLTQSPSGYRAAPPPPPPLQSPSYNPPQSPAYHNSMPPQFPHAPGGYYANPQTGYSAPPAQYPQMSVNQPSQGGYGGYSAWHQQQQQQQLRPAASQPGAGYWHQQPKDGSLLD